VCRPQRFDDEPSYFNPQVNFFNNKARYEQGIDFYAGRFDHCYWDNQTDFVVDATPDNFMHAKRVHDFYQQVEREVEGNVGLLARLKMIVVLREPIGREKSWYALKKSLYVDRPDKFQ
jgi:hypothetical protein